ncbi:hypothetical protein B0T25DRAFT_221162 [Lasiosphaeria hispida]|uniref:Uncharacterized protein n=1 Tax=Lasiosphaeria hispida TaxID=260671 RepID=A0AAJ0MF27_9PEZI|nr:hypothetical protein B0T25DRAFT_221162 [Lasiosphaeria hispida]
MSTTPRSQLGGRRRPSEFLLPDGRKVLVALPEDIEALRQRYAKGHDADPPIQVEVVVHGSDEHRHFLGLSKSHHETRRAQLRERHGPELVDELEAARAELDAISAQLHRLEAASVDSTNRLNENFSRFGFDAKLRTYADDEDDSEDPMSSGVSSVTWTGSEKTDRRRGGEAMRLFRRPIVKQYFHRGLLWRAAEHTEVMSFELFFDLLYVGILAINGDHVAEEPSGQELLRFFITFLMSWKIWADVQQIISWFETNDIVQRLEILFLTACLLGQTTNMLQVFNGEEDTFTQLVAYYLAARLFMAAYCALTAFLVPLVKGMMISQVLNVIAGAAFWIAATFMTPNVHHAETTHVVERAEAATEEHESGPVQQSTARLVLIFVALGVDMFGSAIPVILFRFARSHDTPGARRVGRFFEFFPAINIEHKVERTNAFVSLVFGYSVVGIMFQNASDFGIHAFLGKAILGLCQAYIFNWLYFEVDGSNILTHAIRWRVQTAFVWQYAHLAFIMAYVLAASALSKMVVATDCVNAHLEDLTPFYQHRSVETLSTGLRLYYCIGLGVALFGMGLISLSHEHKIPAGRCRLAKPARLANRLAVCIIIFCLPAAGDSLNSLNLVAITTALSAWVLLLELWGKSCRTEDFFWGSGDSDKCQYTARCGQRRLNQATKSDGEIDIVELGRSEKTAVVAAP